ncbi:MAG: hypothetical protein QXD89_01425, partial [Candidatus Aenigmatarchaeota archaeon]
LKVKAIDPFGRNTTKECEIEAWDKPDILKVEKKGNEIYVTARDYSGIKTVRLLCDNKSLEDCARMEEENNWKCVIPSSKYDRCEIIAEDPFGNIGKKVYEMREHTVTVTQTTSKPTPINPIEIYCNSCAKVVGGKDWDNDGFNDNCEKYVGSPIFNPEIPNRVYLIVFSSSPIYSEYLKAMKKVFNPYETYYFFGRDANWENFKEIIKEVSGKITNNDILIVHLDTHGGEGIIAFPCKTDESSCVVIKDEPFTFKNVPYSQVDESLEVVKASTIISILSCYNESSVGTLLRKNNRALMLGFSAYATVILANPQYSEPWLEKVKKMVGNPNYLDPNNDCCVVLKEFLELVKNYAPKKRGLVTTGFEDPNGILSRFPLNLCYGG